MRGLLRRITELVHRRRLDRETADELATHVDLLVAQHREAGMSEAEARRRARLEAGSDLTAAEAIADGRSGATIEQLLREIGHAARILRRSWALTLLSAATMAIGIGVSTVLFALVDAVILRPLPYPDADRLVRIVDTNPAAGIARAGRRQRQRPRVAGPGRGLRRHRRLLRDGPHAQHRPRGRGGDRRPGQRRLLRRRRRRAADRPRLHRRGDGPGRVQQRRDADRGQSGRDPRPWPVAFALRRRPGCRRPHHHPRAAAVHRGRRHARAVRAARSRRAGVAAVAPRRRRSARPALPGRHRAAGAGHHGRRRRARVERRSPTRWHASIPPPTRAGRVRLVPLGEDTAGAAADALWMLLRRGRPAAARRVRQRRPADADARPRSSRRDRRAAGARAPLRPAWCASSCSSRCCWRCSAARWAPPWR